MKFVSQVFKSYPAMFAGENSSPPFIHWAQMKVVRCESLVNCVNISRMWTNKAAGTGNMVTEIIERQMTRLFDQRTKYNELEMLAALQAYLLYSMMLFFEYCSPKSFVEQDAMIKLQGLAGDVARTGTVCLAETRDTRPDWESWIVASAKRRTLFVASMFDNLVNFTLGTPSFIATELAELPAPASKRLWESSNRNSWNMAYNQHLTEWIEAPFLVSELWPVADMNSARRQQRLGQWLSNVDEFGMMIYSVTAHTYGG
ncbi:uncharacterized protein A1O9_06745 [Exophiala aquamarina CBS 119918]|uniref:Xylanolytic transcriptional activator regulatory domain-containing protein n=1 Tax=Exophiala aquamarina CBS 119918 TaxID=1182545 RepID=A0A072P9W5_9EURO|nr:uncharacterized protein A1O9_06745 [Exophiala aquamarina CBS 119918]KEF56557.1 hypothetical protein A1O9_06745 [Exophiala aquamarina CBS 119918]